MLFRSLTSMGLPANSIEIIKLTRELCDFGRSLVDELFGEGASQTVFGNRINPDMFGEFFEQVIPYISRARDGRVARYLEQGAGNVLK